MERNDWIILTMWCETEAKKSEQANISAAIAAKVRAPYLSNKRPAPEIINELINVPIIYDALNWLRLNPSASFTGSINMETPIVWPGILDQTPIVPAMAII